MPGWRKVTIPKKTQNWSTWISLLADENEIFIAQEKTIIVLAWEYNYRKNKETQIEYEMDYKQI